MSEAMDHFKKIAKVHLGGLVGYTILINVIFGITSSRYDDLSGMLMMCGAVILHALVLFFYSCYYFVKKKNSMGLNYLLMIGAVSLIGFSFCVGGTYL